MSNSVQNSPIPPSRDQRPPFMDDSNGKPDFNDMDFNRPPPPENWTDGDFNGSFDGNSSFPGRHHGDGRYFNRISPLPGNWTDDNFNGSFSDPNFHRPPPSGNWSDADFNSTDSHQPPHHRNETEGNFNRSIPDNSVFPDRGPHNGSFNGPSFLPHDFNRSSNSNHGPDQFGGKGKLNNTNSSSSADALTGSSNWKGGSSNNNQLSNSGQQSLNFIFPIAIAVPVIIGVVLITIIIAVICYYKCKKKTEAQNIATNVPSLSNDSNGIPTPYHHIPQSVQVKSPHPTNISSVQNLQEYPQLDPAYHNFGVSISNQQYLQHQIGYPTKINSNSGTGGYPQATYPRIQDSSPHSGNEQLFA